MPFLHPVGLLISDTTPRDIGDCALWVRSDKGITKDGSDLVSTWADISGNGHDFTSSSGITSPLWLSNRINGHPALRFDGSDDRLLTGNFGAGPPQHVFVVFKNITMADLNVIWYFDNDTAGTAQDRLIQLAGPSRLRLDGNSQAGRAEPSADTTNFHLVSCVVDGNSSSIAIDNDAPASNGIDMGSNANDGVVLGARFNDRYANIEIAEFVLYGTSLSSGKVSLLKDYFRQRYALW